MVAFVVGLVVAFVVGWVVAFVVAFAGGFVCTTGLIVAGLIAEGCVTQLQ